VSTYSGGMQRRLEIARGLLHAPRVLFLDEPTVGLDPQTRVSIWAYINELKQREDITIFLTTHYMDEAENCGPDRDHRPREDRRHRHAGGAEGLDRQGPRPDQHRGRRGRHPRAGGGLRPGGGRARGPGDVSVESGEHFVPQLFARLPVAIKSVSVSRPSLDDVFMSYTGKTIRDAEASIGDRNRRIVTRFGRR